MGGYQKEVTAYTGGAGRLSFTFSGYGPCHNTEEVVAAIGYEADGDTANPSGSVFCAHGAGFLVDWDQVPEYMHLESCLETQKDRPDGIAGRPELPTEKVSGQADGAMGRSGKGMDRHGGSGCHPWNAPFYANRRGNSAGTKSGGRAWKNREKSYSVPW